jgi:hypothetical protein
MTCDAPGRVGRWACRPGFTLADAGTAAAEVES